MTDENLIEWLQQEVASGGRIVVLAAYANHVIAAVVSEANFSVSFKRDEGCKGAIVGVGVKFDNPYEESASIPACPASEAGTAQQNGPPFSYRLPRKCSRVQLLLRATDQQQSRRIDVVI